MSKSYEKIDYRLRPAKVVERKMLAEAFSHLKPFGALKDYCYIGFGSVYFSDFQLFHKQFGFRRMISIEDASDEIEQERFKNNIPFSCIEMEFGKSSEVLPGLDWNARAIVWLDYDYSINSGIFEDVLTVISNLASGSIFLISVNVNSMDLVDDQATVYDDEKTVSEFERKKQKLSNQIGSDRLPKDLSPKDFSGWNFASRCRKLLDEQIKYTLNTRNGNRPSGSRMTYHQLFNFHYRDGAKMLTVGGIVYDEGQRNLFSGCGFSDLEFYKPESEAFLIETPRLTPHEIRKLGSFFPNKVEEIRGFPAPPQDIESFRKIYRYFPHFAESEL